MPQSRKQILPHFGAKLCSRFSSCQRAKSSLMSVFSTARSLRAVSVPLHLSAITIARLTHFTAISYRMSSPYAVVSTDSGFVPSSYQAVI